MEKGVNKVRPRNGILNMEDISIHSIYTLTINPENKLQCFNSHTRVNDCLKELDHVLFYIKNCELYPELSKTGRLHYHGTIWFNSTDEIINFYLNLPHTLKKCTIEIDTISNKDVWDDYCTKQIRFHEYFVKMTYQMIPIQRGRKEYLTNEIETKR